MKHYRYQQFKRLREYFIRKELKLCDSPYEKWWTREELESICNLEESRIQGDTNGTKELY